MKKNLNYFDVTIIGAGRVGLPLALILESKGLKVAISDIDTNLIKKINQKKMPFKEKGMEKLIQKTKIKTFLNKYPNSEYYIVTVGTPLMANIETDLSNVRDVITGLIKSIDIKNKTIILRSTVAPNTTEFISNIIKKEVNLTSGSDYSLSVCPERIVEGDALNELNSLPQMVGVNDTKSWLSSKKLFKNILPSNKILKGSWLDAELGKLFSNIYRYINFAIPNYFMMIANDFGIEPFRLFDLMNTGYPRNDGLKSTGLTAGTCLRKDFGMVNEYFPQTDLILQAYKINEFMPKFLCDTSSKFINSKTNVGILGYTFKAETDDVRDTLSAKIIRYIERLVPNQINISDYNIKSKNFNDTANDIKFKNLSTLELIKKSNVIIICTNHSIYKEVIKKRKFKNKIFIDPWRVLGQELIVKKLI
jgi:UDP-N-acetyl-D-mannosaminuronic acid dehydrogenase|tara:strand:+ start:686 stop:1945 length:1260 start_codon:yes stop_codon:yes gene_type:complete